VGYTSSSSRTFRLQA